MLHVKLIFIDIAYLGTKFQNTLHLYTWPVILTIVGGANYSLCMGKDGEKMLNTF